MLHFRYHSGYSSHVERYNFGCNSHYLLKIIDNVTDTIANIPTKNTLQVCTFYEHLKHESRKYSILKRPHSISILLLRLSGVLIKSTIFWKVETGSWKCPLTNARQKPNFFAYKISKSRRVRTHHQFSLCPKTLWPDVNEVRTTQGFPREFFRSQYL